MDEKKRNKLVNATQKQVRSLGVMPTDQARAVNEAIGVAERVERNARHLDLASGVDIGALALSIARTRAAGEPVTIYAPACPDYANDSKGYVFGSMGDGVSLLGSYQIEFAKKLLPLFENVPVRYALLTADIEGDDNTLLALNRISKDEFDEKIARTMYRTQQEIDAHLEGFRGEAKSSGFIGEFPHFREVQSSVEERVARAYADDGSIRERIDRMNSSRHAALYRKMFEPLGSPGEYLGRTIHTMAQYGALAHEAKARDAIIIAHPTVNVRAYNDPVVSLLDDPTTNFRRTPVFVFSQGIY